MAISYIDTNDGSKKPFAADSYMDMRGVVDFGNLVQFAPYEKGYCFLAVINGPAMMNESYNGDNRNLLQAAYIKILEQEFKGLDGIDDITSENMDVTDNISTMSLISKTNQSTNGTITMRFTEKSGTVLTKYNAMYLRYIKDTKTQAKTYGGLIGYGADQKSPETYPGFHKEVFNMLYVITDSTCYNVEKAFLLLNMQPTTAAYSELYNVEKGDIDKVEIGIPFNVFCVDGKTPNTIAKAFLKQMINSSDCKDGMININSYDYNWSFADGQGVIKKSSSLGNDTTWMND